MKQTKSVSKVGYIPDGEVVEETWDETSVGSAAMKMVFSNKRKCKSECETQNVRKVRATLTLTIEDFK